MKILITGGAGFLGSSVARSLAKSHDVTILDRAASSLSGVTCLQGDVNREETFESLPAFDAIFHYAALVGVKATDERPLEVLGDIDGIRNVLEFARAKNVKRVVYASSSEVYGSSPNIPSSEDGMLFPENPYSTVKLVGEHYMQSYAQLYGLSTCSLRIFNTYGPNQRGTEYGFVVKIFFEKARASEPLPVFGDGSQTRDFVYVEDHVAAATAALTSSVQGPINVGTGVETSIKQLAEEIINITNSTSKIEYKPARRHDVARRVAQVEKAKELSWSPQFSLAKGIRAMNEGL